MNTTEHFEGTVVNIVDSEKFRPYVIRTEFGIVGKTYVCMQFRNSYNWEDLKVSDKVAGLRWKSVQKKLINADSLVELIESQ